MEISHEKSKILVNDPDPNKFNNNDMTIIMYGKKQEQSSNFNIGVTLTMLIAKRNSNKN